MSLVRLFIVLALFLGILTTSYAQTDFVTALRKAHSNDTSFHPCNYTGITCDGNNSILEVRIEKDIELKLSDDAFDALDNLTVLYLYSNAISWRLTLNPGKLTKLLHLFLRGTAMSVVVGQSVCGLKLLQKLTLLEVQLTGKIPDCIGDLADLEHIQIGRPRLQTGITGTFPQAVLQLKKLKLLSLRNNNLSGTVPSNLFIKLPQLETLNLSLNKISGHIPDVPPESSLRSLNIDFTSMSGKIPEQIYINGLKRLEITGLIELSNDLDVSRIIPPAFEHITELSFGSESSSKPLGKIPEHFFNFTALIRLGLINCELEGTIPDLRHFPNLNYLHLSNNKLTGTIPEWIFKLSTAELSNNALSGSLPQVKDDSYDRYQLALNGNNLSGNLPPIIASYTVLNLASNSFSGGLQYLKQAKANTLSLSDNNFTGSIPEFNKQIRYFTINLSGNKFSGSITPEVLNLNVEKLLLNGNSLSGNLPEDVDVSHITQLNLADNELYGPLPVYLKDITQLGILNNRFWCPSSAFAVQKCADLDAFGNNYFCDESGMSCETLGSLNCPGICRSLPIKIKGSYTLPKDAKIDSPTVIQGNLTITHQTTITLPSDFKENDVMLTVEGCLTLSETSGIAVALPHRRFSVINLVKSNCVVGEVNNIRTSTNNVQDCYYDFAKKTKTGILMHITDKCSGQQITIFSLILLIISLVLY